MIHIMIARQLEWFHIETVPYSWFYCRIRSLQSSRNHFPVSGDMPWRQTVVVCSRTVEILLLLRCR